VLAPIAGRQIQLDLGGEEDDAHAVIFLDRRERDQRPDLGQELPLLLAPRPVVSRAREVDQQRDRQLSLFDELLHEEALVEVAGRDVPVDVADVVARGVRTHLGEGHALALEHRMIATGQLRVHRAPGGDLHAAHRAQHLGAHAEPRPLLLALVLRCPHRLRGSRRSRTRGGPRPRPHVLSLSLVSNDQ
jgi:hypothetical protein